MKLSKVLKKHKVVIDDDNIYIIPVSVKPENFAEPENAADLIPEEFDAVEEDKFDAADNFAHEVKTEPEHEPAHENKNKVSPEEIWAEKLKEIEEKEREIESMRDILISRAQRTADLIVNHALETAKNELRNALESGYKEGFEEGKREAMKVINPALDKIAVLAEATAELQDEMLEEFRLSIFDVISEISNKIIHKEIDEKDEYLLTLFSDAVRNIRTEEFVTVTVGTAQAEFAMRNIDLFRAKVSNIDDFEILSDDNAGKGTMIVETAKALADASVNVQSEKIDAILERMKENLSVLSVPNFSDDGNVDETDEINDEENYENEEFDEEDYDGFEYDEEI